MGKEKALINIAILGHVDSGKSTITGHLIYKLGGVDKRTMERFEKEATELGKRSFKYARISDKLQEVYERNVNFYFPFTKIETSKYYMNITDRSAFRDFIKNMIHSMSQAHCAVLMVAAGTGEFEAGISRYGQTREHTLFAYTMGVKQIIVIVNKMDTTEPPYSEMRFNEIKTEVLYYMKKIGYNPEMIPVIPISAWHGDNLLESSEKLAWYKGWSIERKEGNVSGQTFLEALDALIVPQRPTDKPLRLLIEDFYRVKGNQIAVVGRVETGVLKQNMIVNFAPSYLQAQVISIQKHYEFLDEALPGDHIGFLVEGISVKELQHDFVVSDVNNDPAQEVASFIAQIMVLNHPGSITVGYTPVIDCHKAHISCEFVKLLKKIDRRSDKTIEKTPTFFKSGESGLVKMVPLKPICVEKFSDYPSLSQFIIRDIRQIIAVGNIIEVEKRFPLFDESPK